MNIEKMFEIATRKKFRFEFKGLISVEDLWDLSVEQLDTIFKKLNSKSKQSKEESLLDNKSNEDKIIDMKIEIIKHIVTIKIEDMKKSELAKENKLKKQKLLEVLESKKDEDIKNKSIEEIEKMINELN